MADAPPASVDVLLATLSSGERRWILRHLMERGGPVTIAGLAGDLDPIPGEPGRRDAAEGGTVGTVEFDPTALYHVHVPKLAAAGLVEYDREHGELQAASRADVVGQVLDWAEALEA